MIELVKRFFQSKGTIFKRDVPPFPSYICLETTNNCNLSCRQCIYHGEAAGDYKTDMGYIDLELARKVIDQLAEYKCAVMLNGDGETLLHKKFHEIAAYAMERNLPNVYFNTNGNLFNKAFTDRFIEYFKGMVAFSLDGFKESHERLRRGSDYDRVISNINYLIENIKKRNLDIKVNVSFCNYDQGEDERLKFINYWVERVDSVSIGEVYDKDYKMISNQLNKSESEKRLMCGIPWETFIVRWNGEVVPCSNCFSLSEGNANVLGDANTQKLKSIWDGQASEKLRQRTLKWDLKNTICEKCERWNMYKLYDSEKIDGVEIKRSGVFTAYTKMSGLTDR